MNTAKLIHRCRLLCGVLAFVFLAAALALCLRVTLASQEQQRLDSLSRGTVYDRSGNVLAQSEPGQQGQRTYSIGEASSALLGYYTDSHGSDGIERLYGQWLAPVGGDDEHGDLWLTIDRDLQQVCYDSILTAPIAGAVVLDIDSGAVLAAADTPSFEPSELDADYDGVVSRGCVFYNICAGRGIAPGDMFRLPAVCAAVRAGDSGLAAELTSGESLSADLAASREAVEETMNRTLLVGQTIELDCMTLRSGMAEEGEPPASGEDYRSALMGYGGASLSPMQLCMYTAALAREDGSIIKPHSVSHLVSRSGSITYLPGGEVLSAGAFSAEAKEAAGQLFLTHELPGGEFSAMTAAVPSADCDNVWLTACYPARDPQYALTIVMQGGRGSLGEEDVLAAARSIFESIN